MDPVGSSTGNAPQRKRRFKPNAPPKREHKHLPLLPKQEDDETSFDEAKAAQLHLRFTERLNLKVRPKTEKKAAPVGLAFGAGGSTSILKSYKSKNEDNIKNEATSYDGATNQSAEKPYKEPWDYYSNYPVTLPMRRPYSGIPELLDAEEFGEDQVRTGSVEDDVTNAAEELGLLPKDEGVEPSMFFLQLPSMLPAIAHSAEPESSGKSQKLCTLESLPEGLIGKMLVYKSGAVKLKIGDVLYDVFPGVKCQFAQDVVAINAEKKLCCNLGELSNRAVAALDVDSMLDA